MKTAVEWLVEQMIKCELLPKSIHPDNVLFHKAKEMEKQQKEVDYQSGYLDCYAKIMSERLTRDI